MLPPNSTDDQDMLGNGTRSNVEKVLAPIFDSVILLLGVCGHTLVMVILCKRQRCPQSSVTGTGTDVLLLALSTADLVLLSVLPFHTVAIAMQQWPFGSFVCRLVGFLGTASTSASAFTLSVLAISRYMAVVKPARAYALLSTRKVSIVAALLWVPASGLAIPQLVFRTVKTHLYTADGHACFAFLSHKDQLVYALLHFLLAFLFPLVTIAVAYGAIYKFLWTTRQSGTAPQVERYQSKVTMTSVMLVLAFTLCWLPSYGLTLALLADQSSGATGISPRYGPFSVFSRIMALSSTVINPILYVLMSEKFRQDLMQLFKKGGQTTDGAGN